MSDVRKREMGLMAWITVLIGAGCVLFAGVGAVNTALDLDLVLKVGGARTPLPNSYEVCLGLLAVGGLLVGLALFGNFVGARFRAAKGKPLVRLGIMLGAVGFLVVAGRAVQVIALTATYGSMLAYYATDGDLDDVKAELAKSPSPEALDAAVSRAAQYDNVPALKLVLEAGGTFEQRGRPTEHRYCSLGSTPAFVKVAIEQGGVTPATCPDSTALIHDFVRDSSDDAATAEIVALLRKAGWSPTAHPEHDKRTPADWAKQENLPKTLAALSAP